jgi:hypothetical protein
MDPLAILLWCLVLLAVAFTAHWIISKFIPADFQVIAFLAAGIVLLLILFYGLGWPPFKMRPVRL